MESCASATPWPPRATTAKAPSGDGHHLDHADNSQRYFRWAVEVVGVGRIIFATDYPYQPGPEGGVEHFLKSSGLDQAGQERVAHANWDSIVNGICH